MRINWAQFKQKLREDIVVLPHFFRNPVQGMRNLPQWEWPTILVLQGAFAASCSILANLLERDFLGMVTGVIIAPLTNYLMVGVIAGFFYYIFMFAYKRDVPFRQVYVNVLFASIPLVVMTIVAFLLPPIILVGTCASLLLIFVGFVDNFHIPRRPIRNLLMGILAVHVLYWGFQQVQTSHKQKSLRMKATPESLDILEKELNE